jgi:diguanylate cyclase (GGDEF)-like protein/PAS domain S-box-containing protein
VRDALLIALACVVALFAAPAAGYGTPVVTSVRAARKFKPDPTGAPTRVHFHGVVTYFDTVTPNLFVQDKTGGIWVDLRGLNTPLPRPGQLLDIRGELKIGFAPYVAKPQWKVLGSAPFPKPVRLSYQQASNTVFDSQWVEIDGIVRSFTRLAEGNILAIDVITPAGAFSVRVPDYSAPFPMQLVDAKVRFRGVCGASFNQRQQFIAMHVMMPKLAVATVLEPAPADPFAVPKVDISKIGRFSASLTEVHRIRVTGIVTERYPGFGLYLMDGTGGLYVQDQEGILPNPGDEVDVVGFPQSGSYTPVLKSSAMRATGVRKAIVPASITGKQAWTGLYDAQLVTISGVVEGVNLHRAGFYSLNLLSPDNIAYEASFGDPKTASHPPAIGSLLKLTGICSVRMGENGAPVAFKIVLHGPEDALLISSPPWLTGQRAASILIIVTLLGLAVLYWVIDLRRRVARQTAVIKARLTSELALEERYRRMFERNLTGLYIASVGGALLDCNDTCAHILGFPDREALLTQSHEAEQLIAQFHEHLYDGKVGTVHQILNAEQPLRRVDGSLRWVLTNVRLVTQLDTSNAFIEGGLVDITERKAAQDQVQFLAYYDSLTSLPNRSLLKDRLAQALAGARRHKEKVAILFLDLDRFKDINDSLGHSFGDLLLQEVARRLGTLSRAEDTISRVGGDEFLVVLTSLQSAEDIALAAERVVAEINRPYVIEQHSFNISCSVGISVFPDHGADDETLIKNADAAMYRAKESGRNAFRFFTEDMNAELVERLILENYLRLALERNELFLDYQPQMEIATKRVIGVEALLRWRHPEIGLVAPDRFIHLAEITGLIVSIGEWTLRSACLQTRKWHESGYDLQAVAVNVSAAQFRHDGFCAMVKRVLQETGLAPEYLELEITETILLSNADVIFSRLEELKSIGLKLAIDDFGTGYSSLSYLRQLPVSKLKIDRSFINDVAVNPDAAAITAAIIEMAKALSLKVIAEGVETQAQMEFLQARHCDEMQGYLFSRPQSPEMLERLKRIDLAPR